MIVLIVAIDDYSNMYVIWHFLIFLSSLYVAIFAQSFNGTFNLT